MNRIPAAVRLNTPTSAAIYDQNGSYLCTLSASPDKIIGTNINGTSVALSLSSGKVKVYEIRNGTSVYRYTR